MGSSKVAGTPECLIAMHVRRLGAQLNIGDAFGAGNFIKPSKSHGGAHRGRRRLRGVDESRAAHQDHRALGAG